MRTYIAYMVGFAVAMLILRWSRGRLEGDMKRLKFWLKEHKLATVLMLVLATGAVHGQIEAQTEYTKYATLVKDIGRAAFAPRCGDVPAIRLADGVISHVGRLMHEGEFARITAYPKERSVKFYYRRSTDTSPGALVYEIPKCSEVYRDQFIY